MLLEKALKTAALTVTAAAMVLGAATGVSYAGSDGASGGASTTASASPSTTASPSPTATPSDTATATVRFKQQNVVITALSVSDTATSTITVEDRKRGTGTITWNVPRDVKMSGHYKRLRDLQVGFTIHIAGPRAGDAAPTADHIVAPGRNKKVLVRNATVTAVSSAAGTITVTDRQGARTTWSVRGAKVEGKAKSAAALSPGDVVSLRGDMVEGSGKGKASVVRVEKDVQPKKSKGKSKSKK